LCIQNSINNEYELFAVIKKLYSNEFNEIIEFVRNPTIITKNLKKEDFFKSLISELQPITLKAFLNYLFENDGLKKDSVYANQFNFFSNFIDSSGFITLNEVIHTTEIDHISKISDKLGKYKIIPTHIYKDVILELFPEKFEAYQNPIFVKKLGYAYRNDCLYLKKFQNLTEALVSLSEDLPLSISANKLSDFLPINDLDSRYSTHKQECIFLRFSDDNFLNVNKRISRQRIINFRDALINLTIFSFFSLFIILPLSQIYFLVYDRGAESP
jgi:hypothetical protein